MKLLFMFLFCLVFLGCGTTTVREQRFMSRVSAETPNDAYRSINQMMAEVGVAIKEIYPARVSNCSIALSTIKDATPVMLVDCTIATTTEADADYYVDQRSILEVGDSPEAARQAALRSPTRIKSVESAVAAFERDFGTKPRTFERITVTGPDAQNKYWAAHVTFLASHGSP